MSPAQASTIRVLHACIHEAPNSAGFAMKTLVEIVNADLASAGEPHRLSERKLGNILTSLSFTNRTRTNSGYFLWLQRSDRVRIHAAARDYAAEGTRPEPIESCEICTKASAPAPTSAPDEAPTEVESEIPKSELRARGERQARGTRLRPRRSTRVH